MKNRTDFNLGIMFRREHAPEQLPEFARRAESVGFDELWVVEDCFYGSGIASAPAYVSWAREQIESGKLEAGHDREHRVTVFAFACAGSTSEAARSELRPLVATDVASGKLDAQLAPMGILPKVQELKKSGDHKHFEAVMPDSWIDQLAIGGTPHDWSAAIDRLIEAGADTVVLVPLPDKDPQELDRFARHFLT